MVSRLPLDLNGLLVGDLMVQLHREDCAIAEVVDFHFKLLHLDYVHRQPLSIDGQHPLAPCGHPYSRLVVDGHQLIVGKCLINEKLGDLINGPLYDLHEAAGSVVDDESGHFKLLHLVYDHHHG